MGVGAAAAVGAGSAALAAAAAVYRQEKGIVVYTESWHTKARRAVEAAERRIVLMLDQRNLDYQIVFVDLEGNEDRKEYMLRSGGKRLPQLYVNGVYRGHLPDLLEKDHTGELDDMLEDEGFVVRRKPPVETPRDDDARDEASDGPLSVCATGSFMFARWDPTEAGLAQDLLGVMWLLLVDDEPVHLGPECS
jgi:glutaredoxin